MAKAPIIGDTLRWAREVAHVDRGDLAKAAGTTPARIEEFEAGVTQPTFRQLGLLATKVDRPLGFFFAPAPALPDVPEAADFRGRGDEDIPAALAKEMKRAVQHRDAMLDLAGPPGSTLDLVPMTWRTAEEAASDVRTQFGLTERFAPPESQMNQVFNFWRGLVESRGFLVFQTTRIDLSVFRGLSIYYDVLPVIVLNGADSANGRVFTLFHELAHLANRTSGLCVLDRDVNEEAIANRFAAAFLMPELLVRACLDANTEPMEMARAVAAALKVSTLAAGVRLRGLGQIDEEALEDIWDESNEIWEQTRRAQKESDGFVPPWRLRYRDLGPTYIGTVAQALEDARIDAVDATYLLNARLPMVDQLIQEYYRTGGDA
ncbi:XRE family transcriptional regulator [Aeromicrobium sp.]|uniref:helix-turn-helix domain-containing protein n=1 Tax=Aeromicrobium sp. TaxID=1871063 RepID=UPI0028B1478E|nr:XRE family transcriptional regulator [Aeromicrobium sp.]